MLDIKLEPAPLLHRFGILCRQPAAVAGLLEVLQVIEAPGKVLLREQEQQTANGIEQCNDDCAKPSEDNNRCSGTVIQAMGKDIGIASPPRLDENILPRGMQDDGQEKHE